MANINVLILKFLSGRFWIWFNCLLVFISISSRVSGMNVSWCVGPEEKLVNISCDFEYRVHLLRALHSWQDTSQLLNQTKCASLTECSKCVEDYPNAELLLNTCSGLESCVLSSIEIPVPMKICDGIRSNCISVEYECISVINQTTSNDICGRGIKAAHPPTSVGFVTSPNYPHRYDSNTKCSCRLEIVGGMATNEIVLEMMDYDVLLIPNGRNPFDWLRYGSPSRNWGDGRLFNADYSFASSIGVHNSVHTGLNRLVVDFNSDDREEARGFWYKYYGQDVISKEKVVVNISCSIYTPPEIRQVASCLEPPHVGELYLSCTAYGVINILKVTAGIRGINHSTVSDGHYNGTCIPAEVIVQAKCTDTIDISEVGSQCMRRVTCNPSVPYFWNLTKCNQPNDFVVIDYQCISDSNQRGGITDICGEDMIPGTTIFSTSGVGFLSSPLYPFNYPPNCSCFCVIDATSQHSAHIVLYVIDIRLSECSSAEEQEDCDGDWLKYGKIDLEPDTGIEMSSNNIGEPVYTGQNIISVNFHSDSVVENRGFWIKYVGRSSQGSNVPLRVRCGRFATSFINTSNNSVKTSTPTHPPVSNPSSNYPKEDEFKAAGLIVGLTLLTACLIIGLLIFGMILCHRIRCRSTGLLIQSKAGNDEAGNSEIWRRMGSAPFTVFYNEVYKMQDPTLYRECHHFASTERKRTPPSDETLHF